MSYNEFPLPPDQVEFWNGLFKYPQFTQKSKTSRKKTQICLSFFIFNFLLFNPLFLNMFSTRSQRGNSYHAVLIRDTTLLPNSTPSCPAWWLSQILIIMMGLKSVLALCNFFCYTHPHPLYSTYGLYYFFRHIIRLPHTTCLHNKIVNFLKARTVFSY